MKTFKKVLYEKEYKCNSFWSTNEAAIVVKSYIKVEIVFNFRKGVFFNVSVPNVTYCYRNIFTALFRALEHESIGMAKYNHLKESVRETGADRKL